MQAEDIQKMCRALARRFKNYNEYEDLIQEGILAVYEQLREKPTSPPAKLYRVALTRMHDYLNIDLLPFTVPASDAVRQLVRDNEAEVSSSYSQQGIEHLRLVLMGEQVELERYQTTAPSTEEVYIQQQLDQKLSEGLKESLSQEDQLLFYMRFVEGLTQAQVATYLNTSQVWASKREKQMIEKVKRVVANIQHPIVF